MTRPIHAVPLDARGAHLAAWSCACRPTLCQDLLEPRLSVYVHKDAPELRPEPESVPIWEAMPWEEDDESERARP